MNEPARVIYDTRHFAFDLLVMHRRSILVIPAPKAGGGVKRGEIGGSEEHHLFYVREDDWPEMRRRLSDGHFSTT